MDESNVGEAFKPVADSNVKVSDPALDTVSLRVDKTDLNSDEEIPCYQINRDTNRFSHFSEEQESILPLSPVSTPPSINTYEIFIQPLVPTLGTITKQNVDVHSINKELTSSEIEANKFVGLYNELGMIDRDVSWVTTMETPAPPLPPDNFNTLERATLLPEDNVNMQPRALFSPVKNEDYDCTPLQFSSGSEEETVACASNDAAVCKPLVPNEIVVPETFGNDSDKKEVQITEIGVVDNDSSEITERLSPVLSPVFCIKRSKRKLKRKKKEIVMVESPNASNKVKVCEKFGLMPCNADGILETELGCDKNISGKQIVFDKGDNENNGNQCHFKNEPFHSIQDDSFQNISFSCIDELCKTPVSDCDLNMTTTNLHCELNKENCFEIDYKDANNGKRLLLANKQEKCFYHSDSEREVHIVRCVDYMCNSAKRLEEGNIHLIKKCDKTIKYQGMAVFSDIVKDFCDKDLFKQDGNLGKRLRKESGNPSEIEQRRKVMKLNNELVEQQDCYLLPNNTTDGAVIAVNKPDNLNLVAKTNKNNSNCIKNTNINDRKIMLKYSFSVPNDKACLTSDYGKRGEQINLQGSFDSVNCVHESFQSNMVDNITNYSVGKLADTINNFEHENKLTRGMLQENCPVSFSSASGNHILISPEALKKAKSMFSEVITECNNPNSISSRGSENYLQVDTIEGGNTTLGSLYDKSDMKSNDVKNVGAPTKIVHDKKIVEDHSLKFHGFMTASGTTIKVSDEFLKKARDMLDSDIFENEALVKETLSDESKINVHHLGFKTASNNPVQISKASLQKAEHIFITELNAEHILSNDAGMDGKHKNTSSRSGFLDPSMEVTTEIIKDNTDQSSKPFCGFSTASGRNIEVSESSLTKVRKILGEGEVAFEEVNVTGGKEHQKCGHTSITESCSTSKPLEVGIICDEMPGVSSERDCEIGCEITNENSDNSENIPSWLHAYSTSPTLTMDRMGIGAVMSHEKCEQYSTPGELYIIKSPVLGTTDRFVRRQKKVNRGRKLIFTSSPKSDDSNSGKRNDAIPYKISEHNSATKREVTKLDFSVPFKKLKVGTPPTKMQNLVNTQGKLSWSLLEGRRKAREKQKEASQKGNVKPVKGTLLLKREKSRLRWPDIVKGLPEHYEYDILKGYGIREDVINVNVFNAAEYKFNAADFYCHSTGLDNTIHFLNEDGCSLIFDDSNMAGVVEVTEAFFASPGVQPNLISKEWVRNHYRWIVWKLCHYEKSFPSDLGGISLTPNNVLLQLKYRYDREIDLGHRSALKKILERDESASKRMVLCVFDVKKILDANNKSVESDSSKNLVCYNLGVTDGWYSCYAQIDYSMHTLIERSKVLIGTKFITQGAELLNFQQGISALEATENVHLKIHTNSTRRVRWYTKLGFHKNAGPLLIPLHTVLAQGGQIGRLDVIIVRMYPVLFMEKKTDGSYVIRNRRTEDKAAAMFRQVQETMIEKIYQKVRNEMRDKQKLSGKSDTKISMTDLPKVTDPEELFRFYEMHSDPSSFQNLLSFEQKSILMDYQRRREEITQNELSALVREKMKTEKMEDRKVSQFFRIKIVDFHNPVYEKPVTFTIWNSIEDTTRLMAEGTALSIYNAVPSGSRSVKSLQLNSNRQTRYRELTKSAEFPKRKLARLNELNLDCEPLFGEIDCVGIVVMVYELCYGSRLSQTVFIADSDFNFAGIAFWGTCKEMGWENILTPSSVVACINMQWSKSRNLQTIPSLYVTDSTIFTENPKYSYLKAEIDRLKQALPNEIEKFVDKCSGEIHRRLEEQKQSLNHNWNMSASNISDGNLSLKPKYINGFKMKPNASSTPCKSSPLGLDTSDPEPSPIQKRIEKLQNYGEPPPLSPLLPFENLEKFKTKFKVPYKNVSS